MALRVPILGAEAGGLRPAREMQKAVNEKAAAFAEGLVDAQLAWFQASMMLPFAFAKARSPMAPWLDMAEAVASAALAPSARRVKSNLRRLSGR
ncbi:MAG: hypothetical protein WBA44_05025 [Mesorhizobium sp.]